MRPVCCWAAAAALLFGRVMGECGSDWGRIHAKIEWCRCRGSSKNGFVEKTEGDSEVHLT